VTEPLVQTQGEDKIVVELPGIDDPDLAVRTIGQTAQLEFVFAGENFLSPDTIISTTNPVRYDQLPENRQRPFLAPADEDPESWIVSDEEADGEDATVEEDADAAGEEEEDASDEEVRQETYYPTVIDGGMVRNASVGISSLTNEIVVNFQLDGEGGRLMRSFSQDHVGEIMPIVLDKSVISSPRLNDAIGGEGMITGNFTQDEAETLAVQINSGSLPFKLETVGQTQIGATLGTESVRASVNGGLIGLFVVLLFMLFYYRWPGLLADVALILYALFTLAIFRLLPVTLTLAGIAGFVLSIGMAVDANILIFERMKEELRGGRRVKRAIETGFQRAWPSIRDSNISTLITCAILFWFGNQFGASIVKGFAVTLALGVITSLFTAIVVTRTLLNLSNRFVLTDDNRAGTDEENSRIRWLFGV
jgi:preprotein translocase subunit SecD